MTPLHLLALAWATLIGWVLLASYGVLPAPSQWVGGGLLGACIIGTAWVAFGGGE
jgi:hypothetical protein